MERNIIYGIIILLILLSICNYCFNDNREHLEPVFSDLEDVTKNNLNQITGSYDVSEYQDNRITDLDRAFDEKNLNHFMHPINRSDDHKLVQRDVVDDFNRNIDKDLETVGTDINKNVITLNGTSTLPDNSGVMSRHYDQVPTSIYPHILLPTERNITYLNQPSLHVGESLVQATTNNRGIGLTSVNGKYRLILHNNRLIFYDQVTKRQHASERLHFKNPDETRVHRMHIGTDRVMELYDYHNNLLYRYDRPSDYRIDNIFISNDGRMIFRVVTDVDSDHITTDYKTIFDLNSPAFVKDHQDTEQAPPHPGYDSIIPRYESNRRTIGYNNRRNTALHPWELLPWSSSRWLIRGNEYSDTNASNTNVTNLVGQRYRQPI